MYLNWRIGLFKIICKLTIVACFKFELILSNFVINEYVNILIVKHLNVSNLDKLKHKHN